MSKCGAKKSKATTTEAPSAVDLKLTEFKIEYSSTKATAGAVTLNATNNGSIQHEVIVIRTDESADDLTVVDGRVPEDAVDVIDEIPEFEAGTTESKAFDLEPGHYVVFCNIAGHYTGGMRFDLDVVED